MKLLLNICAQDGIISHNSGVGTMVKRYIKTFDYVFKNNDIEYDLNLFTPEYFESSFGYSKETFEKNKNYGANIYFVSNGTNGKKFFGSKDNWEMLCDGISRIYETISMDEYDCVISLFNDTPFAKLLQLVPNRYNHIKIWIPHSTALIHSEEITPDVMVRIKWEQDAIDFINKDKLSYVGVIGEFISKHLYEKYNLLENKSLKIYNGEILFEDTEYVVNERTKEEYDRININEDVVISFGRPEKYKNLDATMKVAKELNMKSLIFTQEYFPGMEYVKYLEELKNDTGSLLFINKSFNLPQYFLNNYKHNIILIVPSLKEISGLVVNEIRKMNNSNVLLVANDIDGIKEQIKDNVDGILVDLNNIEESARKIKQSFNKKRIKEINDNSLITLKEKYNFEVIIEKFYYEIKRIIEKED